MGGRREGGREAASRPLRLYACMVAQLVFL